MDKNRAKFSLLSSQFSWLPSSTARCNYITYLQPEINKAHLLLENHFRCRDYVTEQFFNMHNLNMIPVVLGGANYSAIAPPHSFIDAADFPK